MRRYLRVVNGKSLTTRYGETIVAFLKYRSALLSLVNSRETFVAEHCAVSRDKKFPVQALTVPVN